MSAQVHEVQNILKKLLWRQPKKSSFHSFTVLIYSFFFLCVNVLAVEFLFSFKFLGCFAFIFGDFLKSIFSKTHMCLFELESRGNRGMEIFLK